MMKTQRHMGRAALARHMAGALLLALTVTAGPANAQVLDWLKRAVTGGTASEQPDKKAEGKADQKADKPAECTKTGPISMPSGVDLHKLQLLDQGKRPAIYVGLTDVDSSKADKKKLPRAMSDVVDLSGDQLLRMFRDSVMNSRRFHVFDQKAQLTADYATVMVDLLVTSAMQELVTIEPTRRAVKTTVSVSLNQVALETGEDTLGSAINVEGLAGVTSGGRLVVTSADDMKSPEMKEKLGQEYVKALKDAFEKIRLELESRLRPMAKVLAVDGCDLGLLGGEKHGFAPGDVLVVFRAQTAMAGDRKVLALPKPVAVVKCDGVGTESSQCTLLQLAPGAEPKAGDYAMITTQSLLNQPRPR